MPWSHLVFLLV
jgi:prefoldin subunit 5